LLQLAIDHAILDFNVLGSVYRCDEGHLVCTEFSHLHEAHRLPDRHGDGERRSASLALSAPTEARRRVRYFARETNLPACC
jgi:hypothetical protein